jgi:hypothetical protein
LLLLLPLLLLLLLAVSRRRCEENVRLAALRSSFLGNVPLLL